MTTIMHVATYGKVFCVYLSALKIRTYAAFVSKKGKNLMLKFDGCIISRLFMQLKYCAMTINNHTH